MGKNNIFYFIAVSVLAHVVYEQFWIAFHRTRFGSSLRYIELPIELVTFSVLHELANKCPNLTAMLMDFSTAMQLHDFDGLQVCKLMEHTEGYQFDGKFDVAKR